MAEIRQYRVNTLPASPTPNAIYYLKTGSRYRQYLTDSAGNYISEDDAESSVIAPIGFEYNNVSPRVVYTLAEESLIKTATLSITTPFNGTGASLKVGTPAQPGLLMETAENDPSLAIEFSAEVYERVPAGTQIQITTVPGEGASAGAGLLILELIRF